MTGTALTVSAANLPAHLQARAQEIAKQQAEATAGIRNMAFSKLGIKGGKFQIKLAGEESQTLTDPSNDALPLRELPVVVAGWSNSIAKTFYIKKFTGGEGVDAEPDCTSEDGIVPDEGVKNKQADACANCPKNVFGSKINEKGKKVKACDDSKVIVVIPVDYLGEMPPLQYKMSAMAMKNWKAYVDELSANGLPLTWVKTILRFDLDVEYPLMTFSFGGILDEEQIAVAEERAASEDVKRTARPRSYGSATPAPAAAQEHSEPQAPAQTPASEPVPPVQTEAPQPAGAAPKKGFSFGKKDAAAAANGAAPAASGKPATRKATTPAATPAAPPAAKPAAAAYDPLAGTSDAIRHAIEQAGGLDSEGGRGIAVAVKIDLSVYDAIKAANAAPAPATAPAAAAKPATTPVPPAAPAAAVGGGGQAGSLKSILSSALKGKQ